MTTGAGGRPPQPLDIDAGRQHFVGVKLTADTAHGVLTDLRADIRSRPGRPARDPRPAATSSRPSPRSSTRWRTGDPSLPSAWASAASCVDFGDVRRAPFLGWRDVDLGAKLTSRLRCPVALANDLAALMEAEHWFGDGRSVEHFAVLTIGASVGGALVVHDRLVTGADAGLGLLGHFPIDPLGPACAEGHRGCAHSLMSIDGVQSQAALAFGRHLPYAEVLDLAEAGDPAADRIVGTAARALGTLIAAVANIAMPERVILTGEGIRLAQVGWERVLDGVRSARNPEATALDIRVLNDDPQLWARGAAAVAIQRFVLDDLRWSDSAG